MMIKITTINSQDLSKLWCQKKIVSIIMNILITQQGATFLFLFCPPPCFWYVTDTVHCIICHCSRRYFMDYCSLNGMDTSIKSNGHVHCLISENSFDHTYCSNNTQYDWLVSNNQECHVLAGYIHSCHFTEWLSVTQISFHVFLLPRDSRELPVWLAWKF